MVITTIHPVRRTVSAAIRYIIDGDKTGDHSLVQSFMCEGKPDRAAEQFWEVRQRVGTGRSATLAQHLIQSFLPGEVTPEQAMMIGEELCHRLLGEQYQFVIATHIDHSHIHNHIVFNKLNSQNGDLDFIRITGMRCVYLQAAYRGIYSRYGFSSVCCCLLDYHQW